MALCIGSGNKGGNATQNGGTGGNGYGVTGGGGAGNPGGKGGTDDINGETGTGGLLIIYADSVINNGEISSNGSDGGIGNGGLPGGGASGGGTVNIFYKTTYTGTKPIATGGKAITGGGTIKIWGGSGSVSIGSISTGKYVEDEN